MKDQLQTIRAGLETATCYSMLGVDAHSVQIALTALTQLEAMVVEPYGTVTVVRKPGCADMHWFYRWPDPPYLDNAAECHTVYTAAPVAQQPQAEAVPQKHEDIKRLIQWFGAVQDLNPAYLEPKDFELLARLKAPQQAEAVRAKLGKEKVMNDPYASEADTKALLQRDTRTPAEKKLDQMLDERWANEQGVDAVGVLRQIAIELIAQQAEVAPEMHDALCPALTGGDCTCTPPAIIDKAWAQFCGGIGRGPDAPYPGMIEAFESHYGQRFTDKDWREETGVWAAAWKAAKVHGEEAPQQAEAVPSDVVRDAARYRFIRDNCNRRINIEIDNAGLEISDTVDAAIDAAIAQGAKT